MSELPSLRSVQSRAESIDSFATAPEFPSEPSTPPTQKAIPRAPEEKDEYCNWQNADSGQSTTARINSADIATAPDTHHDEDLSVWLQADIIAELIDSLHKPNMDIDAAHRRRNDSVYTFEPLEHEALNAFTSLPSSQHVSAHSLRLPRRSRSSLPHSRLPTSKAHSFVTPRTSEEMHRNKKPASKPKDNLTTFATRTAPLPLGPADNDESHGSAEETLPPKYPPPAKLAVILISLYIAIFLVALDRTIIGPAIPEITNKFNSIADIGWYGCKSPSSVLVVRHYN